MAGRRLDEEVHAEKGMDPHETAAAPAVPRRRPKAGRRIAEILLGCVLAAGIAMILYPTVSDWWNSMHQSEAIASYQQAVADTSAQKIQEMWDAAVAYNAQLSHDASRFSMTDEEKAEYDSLLDVTGTGIMGYVSIPKINVQLPIYHGTDSGILQVAIGHIPGSSLPTGGEGTHCVISGHRGLPSARLFTDIDQLAEGDLFTLNVCGRTLTYQVDQIRIVLPDELDDLAIDDGLDLCTLVTCTPYGVNTHRLLVRGHRVDTASLAALDGNATRIDPVLVATILTAVVLAFVIAVRSAAKALRKRAGNRL
ncbi:MAG: class C sortase [Atopobiaceae bacterium]|jgi:sortase A